MGWVRWSDVSVPLVVLAAVTAFAWFALFSGDEAQTSPAPRIQASAAARTEAARLPACTRAGAPVNFAFYTLGPRFGGLKQSHVVRRCDRPELDPPGVSMATAGGNRHAFRANYTSVIYGDCHAGDDAGCALPLEVQTWPACERNAGTYEHAKRPNMRIRGAPAAVFDGGTQIEVYTGRATVVVSGTDPGLVKRAARAVAPLEPGTRFSAKVAAAGVGARAKRPLAGPARAAMKGRLRCRQVSASSQGGGV